MYSKVTKHKRTRKNGASVVRTHKRIKDPRGGLTSYGRKHFKKKEGANLKPGVKNYSSASLADKKRWISWASRFYGQASLPPLKKPNGEPTRLALTSTAWGEKVPTNKQQARAIYQKALNRKRMLGLK